MKWTPEMKRKSKSTRLARYGDYNSPKNKQAVRIALVQRNKSDTQRLATSVALKGVSKSPSSIAKRRQTMLERYGSSNNLLGKKRPDQSLAIKKAWERLRQDPIKYQGYMNKKSKSKSAWWQAHTEYRGIMAALMSDSLVRYWSEHPEAKERLSRIMRPTSIEILGQESLVKRGEQFFSQRRIENLVTPDQILANHKIAIFEDGCFFHGCPIHNPGEYLVYGKSVSSVRVYDLMITIKLQSLGWTVIRVWQHEFKEDPDILGKTIDELLQTKYELTTEVSRV